MANDKLSKEFIDKWKHLLSEVNMDEVPIEYIERVDLYFNNGKNPSFIDITALLKEQKPWKIERVIERELDAIDEILERVDFHLNFEKVVRLVDTATKDTLKKL